MDERVNTILAQLGGNAFCAMTGANTLTGGLDGDGNPFLRFRLPRNKTIFTVTLDAAKDLYRMQLATFRARVFKIRDERDGIHAEDMRGMFESMTGLYVSLSGGSFGNPA